MPADRLERPPHAAGRPWASPARTASPSRARAGKWRSPCCARRCSRGTIPPCSNAHRTYRCTDQGGHRFRFALRAGADVGRSAADAAAFHLPPACLDWTKGMLP